MKKIMYKSALLWALLATSTNAFAAGGMEEYFYESGKIKVVVTVAAIVLAGILFYIFSLERRLKRLEKKK